MSIRLPQALNIVLCVLTLFLLLGVSYNPPRWLSYPDENDYLRQAGFSLFSSEFYAPKRLWDFSPRPFTVPLLYKMVSGDPTVIVVMQKVVHCLAAFSFAFVILLLIRSPWAGSLFVVLWYVLMGWWNIVGWTYLLLSESLATSFLFFWLASLILLWKRKTSLTFAGHIAITILFSFTRDTWPYVIVFSYLLFLLAAVCFQRERMIHLATLLCFGMLLFAFQARTSKIGERHRLPVINNIVIRILPEPGHLDWFSRHGMPQARELQQRYGDLREVRDIYPLYVDSSLLAFTSWAGKEGRSAYSKFLLTHPDWLVLNNEKKKDLDRLFAYNFGYTGPIRGHSKYLEPLLPFFNFTNLIILNFFLLLVAWKKKIWLYLLPSVLMVVFTFNAYLSYAADALEVERHVFITNIMIQVAGILVVSFLADHFFTRFSESRTK